MQALQRPVPPFIKLCSGLSGPRADIVLLVLASRKIPAKIENSRSGFDILVQEELLFKAQVEVQAFDAENQPVPESFIEKTMGLSVFGSVGAWGIMAVLCLIHMVVQSTGNPQAVFLKYGAATLYIVQGETYRALTALFFHADTRHLIGNMAGILMFASPLFTISGGGVGMFLLLFSGTAANLICAGLRGNAAISIGASTAVMAAAGLLCAFQLLYRKKGSIFHHLIPLFSGALLVAMLSQGENTDIPAHLYGFTMGLVTGFFFFPLNRLLVWKKKQIAALIFVLALVSVAGFQASL